MVALECINIFFNILLKKWQLQKIAPEFNRNKMNCFGMQQKWIDCTYKSYKNIALYFYLIWRKICFYVGLVHISQKRTKNDSANK